MGSLPSKRASATSLPFYSWETAGKPIVIRLSFDVIDRMSPEVLRGLGALKRRGAEVGGLLLGTAEPDFPQRVTITDFEPVASEYLTGPSYNLSPNDLAALEAAIARHQSETAGVPQVVGFYRSHTRDELFMDEADLALAERYFPGAENVFLLIKPFATSTSVGGFFFREDGEISSRSSYLQFPFSRTELGGGARPAPPVPPQADLERSRPPYTPASQPERQPAAAEEESWQPIGNSTLSILSPPPEPASRLPGWRQVLAPAFIVLACAALYFGYENLSGAKKPLVLAGAGTALPLKLSVSEKLDQLDVTWDRTAPAIILAKRGVLSISDGANRRDLELSGVQLRNGRVLYSRLSGDVGLRLEVFADGPESVSESIRIVSVEPGRRTPPVEPVAEQPPPPKPNPAPNGVGSVTAPKNVVQPTARTAPVRPAASTSAPSETNIPAAPAVQQPEAQQPEVELQRPDRRR